MNKITQETYTLDHDECVKAIRSWFIDKLGATKFNDRTFKVSGYEEEGDLYISAETKTTISEDANI